MYDDDATVGVSSAAAIDLPDTRRARPEATELSKPTGPCMAAPALPSHQVVPLWGGEIRASTSTQTATAARRAHIITSKILRGSLASETRRHGSAQLRWNP